MTTTKPYTIHRDGTPVGVALGEDPRDALTTYRIENLPPTPGAYFSFTAYAEMRNLRSGATYTAR